MTSRVARLFRTALVACLLAVAAGILLRAAPPLIQVGDAFVAADAGGWVIGNTLIRYSLGRTGSEIGIREIADAQSGRDWHRSGAPDTFVRVNGQTISIGTAPLVFVEADAGEWFGGVRLNLRYRLASAALVIERSYACYPGSAIIETWTTFRQEGGQSVTLADLTNFAFAIEQGTLNWVGGLQTTEEQGGPFERYSGDLDDGQVFFLGSSRRSSEQNLPWFSVEAGGEQFFGSIVWSGAWRFRTERRGDAMSVQIGLPSFDTTLAPGGRLETPHALFGLTNRLVPDTSSALQAFVHRQIRLGRGLATYVTYNTWYSKGTAIDEESLTAEMDQAAAMGVEQFVVDAGWWAGSNVSDPGDFVTKWGSYDVDMGRFPHGLGALSDYAHALGMRFGVWVEPERFDRTLLGSPGMAEERFLATTAGRYDEGIAAAPQVGRRARSRYGRPKTIPIGRGVSAQVCLVDRDARAWLYGRLVQFIEAARPDYLKWDNNFWIECDRPGHGHGQGDANFLHHQALGTLLDDLRERFPDLDIENCASGGNRLSLDMLARTDAAWLDDRTDPSSRVRHGIQGLLGLLPPAYMMSFATAPAELAGVSGASSATYVLRSRMLGAPGVSWGLTSMDDGSRAEVANGIALFKRIRPVLQDSAAILLTSQVRVVDWSGWDAVEHVTASGRDVVVMVYNTFDAPQSTVIRPVRLLPDATYTIESADEGVLGTATGAQLMSEGLSFQSDGNSIARVILLHAE